jgi:large subunit ribosomal protein L13
MYRHHSLYPGGLKEVSYRKLLAEKPEFAVYEAVRGMLPKGPLGRKMLKKLKIYRGAEHKNQAQKPEVLDIRTDK